MDAERLCPRCSVPLHTARGSLMAVNVCTQCGGAFFDHGEFANLTRKHPDQLRKLEAIVKPEAVRPDQSESRTPLRCPSCADPMQSYEYAECSGVWLDRCAKCMGVWVDDGELQRVQEHLERGHKVLVGAAETGEGLVGAGGEALPGMSADRWRSIGAVAGVLGRHYLLPI